MSGAVWTDQRIETLKKLWADGLSCSRIAAELGGDFTRNAVIGKVHRLKLTERAKPAPKVAQPVRRPPPGRIASITAPSHFIPPRAAPVKASAPIEATEAVDSKVIEPSECVRKTLFELQHNDCRWPLGDPQDRDNFRFCAAVRENDSKPYCAYHNSIAVSADSPRNVRSLDKIALRAAAAAT